MMSLLIPPQTAVANGDPQPACPLVIKYVSAPGLAWPGPANPLSLLHFSSPVLAGLKLSQPIHRYAEEEEEEEERKPVSHKWDTQTCRN